MAVNTRTFSGGTFRILRQDDLVAGHALGRNLDGVAFALLVEGRQRDARLHRDHGDPGVDDVELRHVGGAGKCRLDPGGVAIVIIERDVIRDVVVELGRAGLDRLRRIGDGRQRVDVEHHGFRGVTRLRQRLRHHEGHGIADIAHLVGHQRGAVGLQQGCAVAVLQRQAADEGCILGLRKVGPGPDPEHARHGPGGHCVDAADDPVRMR